MNAREKELKVGTLYGKLAARNLNLAPLQTVKRLDEKTGVSEEALTCPHCFNPVMTGWTEHIYTQYKHYICKHCESELVFVAFSDHPDETNLRLANLVMIN